MKTIYGIEQHGPIIESVHNYIDIRIQMLLSLQ